MSTAWDERRGEGSKPDQSSSRYSGHREEDQYRSRENKDRHRSHEEDRRRREPYSRSRSRSPDRSIWRDRAEDHSHHHKTSRRSRRSLSRSGHSTSESESDSEDDRRRRRKEARRREEKDERRKRKERRREKREKKEKRKGTAASTAQWGKYGIISEVDIVTKGSEFRAWLVEERKVNPETLSKEANRREFASFIEDFNTATLPHEKFYNMAKHDIRMNMIRSGQQVAVEDASYDPLADMKAHNSKLKSQAGQKESVLSRDQILELRRLESERIEVGKRRQLGLEVPKHLGVRTEEVANYSFDGGF